MNKAQLAEKLQDWHSKDSVEISKKHADDMVDFVFDCITETLKKEDEVSIAGFGGFVVKQRKARTARNPRTGEPIQVPAMRVPKFRAAKALKDAVR